MPPDEKRTNISYAKKKGMQNFSDLWYGLWPMVWPMAYGMAYLLALMLLVG